MRLHKRNGTYYASIYEHQADGSKTRVRKSTGCTDKAAAEAVARRWERDATDPSIARTRDVTLQAVLTQLVAHRTEQAEAGAGSRDTAAFYALKAGSLLREIGAHFAVARLDASVIDAYISTRRAQWADDARTRRVSDHTISKELTTLRAALKLALRRGQWRGQIDAVFPKAGEFSPRYEPRTTHLSPRQAQHLLAALVTANHNAIASFVLATGAEWRAVQLAQRGDVDLVRGFVQLRGTKTASRFRSVPVVTDWQRALLVRALEYAEGEAPLLFAPWTNVRHDLHVACKAAGCAAVACPKLRVAGRGACKDPTHREYVIPLVSPHDLRRTFAIWLRASGLSPAVLGAALGHRDGRMVERVYGKLTPEMLAHRMRAEISGTPVGQTGWTGVDLVDGLDDSPPASTAEISRDSVPRDGIEPPTRGFSVPVLGWRAPRKRRAKRTASESNGTRAGQRGAK